MFRIFFTDVPALGGGSLRSPNPSITTGNRFFFKEIDFYPKNTRPGVSKSCRRKMRLLNFDPPGLLFFCGRKNRFFLKNSDLQL